VSGVTSQYVCVCVGKQSIERDENLVRGEGERDKTCGSGKSKAYFDLSVTQKPTKKSSNQAHFNEVKNSGSNGGETSKKERKKFLIRSHVGCGTQQQQSVGCESLATSDSRHCLEERLFHSLFLDR
jgi:hypothetical protein